jgi:hypothetical protein
MGWGTADEGWVTLRPRYNRESTRLNRIRFCTLFTRSRGGEGRGGRVRLGTEDWEREMEEE